MWNCKSSWAISVESQSKNKKWCIIRPQKISLKLYLQCRRSYILDHTYVKLRFHWSTEKVSPLITWKQSCGVKLCTYIILHSEVHSSAVKISETFLSGRGLRFWALAHESWILKTSKYKYFINMSDGQATQSDFTIPHARTIQAAIITCTEFEHMNTHWAGWNLVYMLL